ncbi:hypothetical protein PSEUDO8Z_60444 [Pseudomonas sp. 8Z]|nr:hypothetical protein PSEUDO8Z_60444 [Pseudomonas sp. 8Z]
MRLLVRGVGWIAQGLVQQIEYGLRALVGLSQDALGGLLDDLV